MTETRITYRGSGPLIRTLVQELERAGVTVTVRREGPYVGPQREYRAIGDAVSATLLATGEVEAIEAGVRTFRQRFANRARVSIEDDEPPADGRGTPGSATADRGQVER
jgi:hypothetical protein